MKLKLMTGVIKIFNFYISGCW